MKRLLASILIAILPSAAMLPAQSVNTGNHRKIFTAVFVPAARVQSGGTYVAGGNKVMSYTSAGAGHLFVTNYIANGTPSGVSDSQGDTFTAPAHYIGGGSNGEWVSYSCGIAGGSGSITWSGATTGHATYAEYSNIKGTACLDTIASLPASGTSTCTTPSTSFLANDALVILAAEEPSTTASYSTSTSGFSLYVQNGGGAAFSSALFDNLNVSAGSYSPTISNVSSNFLYCVTYGFKHA